MRGLSARMANPTTTRPSPILRMPNLPDTGALFSPPLDCECPSCGGELAVKLVHRLVQAIECKASDGEDATVNGKDHQKNIDAVGHGRSLLTTDRAAAGRMRSHPPSTRGPGWQPPLRVREHLLRP